ncbi:META domain-containing protein [Nocardia cyriacigeorgica]|uniref:META domain-containing protein n=1 Tax=Nocardia cyriacigeorgica TaxID=135487 RepID=UPI0018935A64|nr:META domain-containing protein [Nocardia cyriacigeorgica]MBF6088017.1 META domain-containing protein [Nocardia cyriacigeorgica]MBF6094066.1 META domain-containing protein [Nocardia cyriacigeorgica]
MSAHLIRFGAALLLTLAAATACANDDDAEPTGPAPTPMGHTYISTEVEGAPIPGGGPLTLTFAEGRVSASAGCNTHSGAVELDGNTVKVSGLASTLMACPGEKMGADEWLSDLLNASPSWRLDDARLTLEGNNTTVVMMDKEVLLPDRPLRGTPWVVTALLTPDAQIHSQKIYELRPTFTIAEDGTLTGFAGCNRMTGSATITDTPEAADIAFRVATTKMMCDPETMEVEQAVLAALDGTAQATVDADVLTLRNPNGHGLTLRAQ